MPDLTRVTVNLRPRTMRALERQVERTDMNQTDVINQAVVLLDLLASFKDDGVLEIRSPGDGLLHRIYIL